MRSIRILFAEEVSPLLRDLFRRMFAGYDDLEIMDETVGSVGGGLPSTAADVVIRAVGAPNDGFRWPPAEFAKSPGNVLAITVAGTDVTLCEIHPHGPALHDPPADRLVAAIRNAVAQWR